MLMNFDGLEFLFLMMISPAIIGFIMGFIKRTNWILVLLVSLLVDIILVMLEIIIYELKYNTIIDIIKRYYHDDIFFEFTYKFIPFSLLTYLIARLIRKFTNNDKISK